MESFRRLFWMLVVSAVVMSIGFYFVVRLFVATAQEALR